MYSARPRDLYLRTCWRVELIASGQGGARLMSTYVAARVDLAGAGPAAPHDAAIAGLRVGQPEARTSASGSAVLLEGEHDAPDLEAAVDPAMRFDDLREGQNRIDHRLQLSALGQLHESPVVVSGARGIALAAADHGLLPRRGEHLPEIADDHQEAAARFQRTLDPRVRGVSVIVHDHVIALPVAREIFRRVVDDVVGPKTPDQFHVGAAAHGGHLGTEMLGELHGHGAHRTGGPVDQHRLTGGEFPPPEEDQSRHAAEAERHGILVAQALRDLGDRSLFGYGDVLGVAAEVEPA